MLMPDAPKIVISSDHAGYALKEQLLETLQEAGYTVQDLGPESDDSVDYPDFAHPLAQQVNDGQADLGVLMCGSANGVAMTANKHPNVRAAIAWNDEIAELARSHNNANVICLPARFVSAKAAKSMLRTFLETKFEGGRHERRINKIAPTQQKA
jgi:ribose 5-phosphate isomerase B